MNDDRLLMCAELLRKPRLVRIGQDISGYVRSIHFAPNILGPAFINVEVSWIVNGDAHVDIFPLHEVEFLDMHSDSTNGRWTKERSDL